MRPRTATIVQAAGNPGTEDRDSQIQIRAMPRLHGGAHPTTRCSIRSTAAGEYD